MSLLVTASSRPPKLILRARILYESETQSRVLLFCILFLLEKGVREEVVLGQALRTLQLGLLKHECGFLCCQQLKKAELKRYNLTPLPTLTPFFKAEAFQTEEDLLALLRTSFLSFGKHHLASGFVKGTSLPLFGAGPNSHSQGNACSQGPRHSRPQPCLVPSTRRPVLYLRLSTDGQLKRRWAISEKSVKGKKCWCSLRFSPTVSTALLRPKIRKQALQVTLSKMLLGEVVLNRNRKSQSYKSFRHLSIVFKQPL